MVDLRKFMVGQKIIVDTWTTSRRSTSPAAQPGTSGTVTKTPSYWYAMMTQASKEVVDALINFLNTQPLVQHDIEDFRVNTHTIDSAAMAVPTLRCTATSLIMTHVSLSAHLITTPHPLLPLFLKLPSHKPFTAFHA